MLKPIIAIVVAVTLSMLIAIAGSNNSALFDGMPIFMLCASVGFVLHWLGFHPCLSIPNRTLLRSHWVYLLCRDGRPRLSAGALVRCPGLSGRELNLRLGDTARKLPLHSGKKGWPRPAVYTDKAEVFPVFADLDTRRHLGIHHNGRRARSNDLPNPG